MIKGLAHLSYQDRLKELDFSRSILEKRKLKGGPHYNLSIFKRETVNRGVSNFLHGLIMIGQGGMVKTKILRLDVRGNSLLRGW